MASEIWSQILSVHLVSKLLLGARFCKSTYQSGLRRRTRRWRGRCRSWCGEKVQGLQRERRKVFFLQWWVLKGPKLNKFFFICRAKPEIANHLCDLGQWRHLHLVRCGLWRSSAAARSCFIRIPRTHARGGMHFFHLSHVWICVSENLSFPSLPSFLPSPSFIRLSLLLLPFPRSFPGWQSCQLLHGTTKHRRKCKEPTCSAYVIQQSAVNHQSSIIFNFEFKLTNCLPMTPYSWKRATMSCHTQKGNLPHTYSHQAVRLLEHRCSLIWRREQKRRQGRSQNRHQIP